tara:strand:+ start:371 stop:613 length:243 start_codon:yes stop_codon:yes gene_type:complete
MIKQQSFRKRTRNYILHRFVLQGVLRGNPIWFFIGSAASLFWFKSLLTDKNRKRRIFTHQLELGEEAKFLHLSQAKANKR